MRPPDVQTTLTDDLTQDVVERLHRPVPGLTILAHPDSGRIGEETALTRLASGEKVELSRLEPAFAAPGRGESCRPLEDPYLSRRPLYLLPDPESGGVALDGSSTRIRLSLHLRGAREPAGRAFSAADVDRGVILVLNARVALLLHRLDPIPAQLPRYGLVGDSGMTARLRREIHSAAGLDVPVLLRGETGTGKELVARALHDAGQRRQGPYVALNMAALPAALAAAELFGAARGAYTGAERSKAGFFHSARGGTLFLDEIGEAPVEVQALLLRALETHEIHPVGSVETIRTDVRVIAATDAELETEIGEGRFRAPLLHRLAGYELTVPALRDRRDDVARLLDHFLRQELDGLDVALSGKPWLPAEVVARLVDYDWPGNVRQLRNVARRLAIARHDRRGRDELRCLVDALFRDGTASPPTPEPPPAPMAEQRPPRRPTDVSEEELLEALESHQWRPRPTSRALGISPPALYRLIDRCPRIRKAAELTRGEIEGALSACRGDRKAAAHQLKVSAQGLRRRMTELGLD